MEKEKRKYKRIRQNFVVKLRQKEEQGKAGVQAEWQAVTAENLSGGGALFYYHKKLNMGEILDFQIYFPARKGNISCIGKVVRAERPSGSVIYRTGVEFIEINEKERKLIDKVAKKFLSR